LDAAVSIALAAGEITTVITRVTVSSMGDISDDSIIDTDIEENQRDIPVDNMHEITAESSSSVSHFSFRHQSPHLSRASSTLSLSSSSGVSSVTVTDVRSLTSNYQKMLAKATKEIKKLNKDKLHLEKEQEKLLTVNIELATEAKRLVKEVKDGEEEKKGLLAANEEFAEEVKRLYKEEEVQEEEIRKLKEESIKKQEQLSKQMILQQSNWDEEKSVLERQKENLQNSVSVLTTDKNKLLKEIKDLENDGEKSLMKAEEEYRDKILKLDAEINSLQRELEAEQILKEDSENHADELTNELEHVKDEIKKVEEEHREQVDEISDRYLKQIKILERKSESLAAENFELAVEKEAIDKKMKSMSETKRKMELELNQLKVENQWLVNNSKKNNIKNTAEDMEREIHDLRLELKAEKEKVRNLSEWKNQLAEKNKILKEENNRLLKKTDDLELVMNDEVADINEMLKAIQNLQDTGSRLEPKNLKRYM